MAQPKGGAIGLQNGTGAKGLNMKEPPPDPAAQGGANGTPRARLYLVALPFNILEAIGHGGFHGAWHLLFFVGCAFRAFTAFMVLAATIMLPIALGVFVDQSAAPFSGSRSPVRSGSDRVPAR